ncbi:hypothetical protein OIU76_028380 [Salix suchowensis]|nr:hypothetical protein OIU76_028380 [Salix suchowensis]
MTSGGFSVMGGAGVGEEKRKDGGWPRANYRGWPICGVDWAVLPWDGCYYGRGLSVLRG